MADGASAKFVIVVDDTKLVKGLGGSKLVMPMEVIQSCWRYNAERFKTLQEVAACEIKLRRDGDNPYVTDDVNKTIDLTSRIPSKMPTQQAGQFQH